ncbi:glycosyltransferase [Aliihoeflea sp. 2WW]|uniref:glycosyltransferase n=1 Tax=Aliihoeflea sp. 2WW TaxID=1381123 RepID=UPI000463C48D|nr:glycosyltransferase [Aliihoeflea sp. 2WW]
MNIKSIAIFYGHVASNVGDIAINRGEVNLLQAAYPQAQITAVLLNVKNSRYMETSKASFGPEGAVRLVEVSDSDVSGVDMALDPERWLAHCGVADADLVVLAAGEHLFSYEGNENPRNLFWRTLPAFAARQAGKGCLVMPSTFGPYETKSARALMEALIAGGPRIAARETRSIDVLRELAPGFEPQALLDPAFFIVPPPARAPEEGPRNIALVMRSGHWGMRIAEDARLNIKADDPEMAEQETAYRFSLDFSRKVLDETEHRVTMFVQTDADRAIAEAVERELSGSPQAARFLKRPVATIDDYLEALSAADHVVASRFHALILGMVCGKPGYGLYFASHGHKIPGLMDLVGRPSDCLDLSTMEVGQTVQAAFDAATGPLDFSQTAARLEALRAATMDWLKGEWVQVGRSALDARDIAALAATAGSFYHEQAHRFSADAYRRRRQLTNHDSKSEQMQAAIEASDQMIAKLTFERDASRQKNRDSQKRIEILENAIIGLEGIQIDHDAAIEKWKHGGRRIQLLEEQIMVLKQITAERDELELRIEEREQRIQALEADLGKLKKAKEERDALRADLILRMRQISNLEKSLESLQAVKTQNDVLHTQKADWSRRVSRLEMRLHDLENSTTLRIGSALVASARSPKEIAGLPKVLLNIYKDSKLRKTGQGSLKLAEDNDDESEFWRVYRKSGPNGLIQWIATLHPTDEGALRSSLMSAAKELDGKGEYLDGIVLLRHAVKLDKTDASLRALYWSLQREVDLEGAWAVIRDLRALYGEKPTKVQRERLAKLSRSAAFQLSVVEKVQTRSEKKLTPVSNRICYVLHNSLPFASGGYATRAQGVALGLKSAGFDVVALTRPGFPLDAKPELTPDSIPLQDEIEGIPYRRLLTPSRQGSSAVGYMEAAADAMAAEFEKIRPAFVLAASNYQTALPALLAARRLGIPFAYEIRGFWEITRISREPEFIHTPSYKIQELLEAETAKRADHVFTLTGPMKQEMVRRGVAADHITLLPNSCQPERFLPRPRDEALAARLGIPSEVTVIGYIGTFVQYEGLELLVEAAANLRDRGLSFRLLLVGNENVAAGDAGPITTEVQRIAQERGLDDWLIMPGRVPHDQVESYYSLIDIAPFPRKAQPVTEMVSPMKPLEAYAMEKAVVASSVGALQEMVQDGKTGLIFEKDNVASLTDTLALLIAEPELRMQLGREGRRWVEAERTWDSTAKIAADKIKYIIEELQ